MHNNDGEVTPGPPCDAERIVSAQELADEARDMAIRLEAEHEEAEFIAAEKRRRDEWLLEYIEGAA